MVIGTVGAEQCKNSLVPTLVTTDDVITVTDVVVFGGSLIVKAVGDGPGVKAGNKLEVTVDGILIGGK